MKKNKVFKNAGHKAAAAALAFISFTPLQALPQATAELPLPSATIPALPDEEGALRNIRMAFRDGEADAVILMKDFLNRFPASEFRSEVTLMLADSYFFAGEYPSALKYYSNLRDDSFSGNVREGMLYRKAYSQIKTGFYKEAAAYMRQLRRSKEYGENALFYTAYIDYVNGKYDDAYSLFTKIKNSGPHGAEAEYYINQIDYSRGDFKKVAVTSERLLTGSSIPDELRAETMRVGGLSYFKLGDYVNARNILSRYVALTGDGAEITALYSLATIYYDEGNYAEALPLFSIVTEYPGNLAQSSWLYIGQIYMAQGDAGAAALAFDKAAKESWDNGVAETAAYNLAVTSTEGRALPFSDAATAMESFIDTYPASPYAATLSNYLANAYYGRRDYENAMRQVDKISNPDSSTRAMRQKILYQLGVSNFQHGNLSKAIETLKEAAAPQAPDREVAAQASLWLGDALYAGKDYKEAAKAYNTALGSGMLGDNTALADYNLGYAYLKLHNYKEAEKAFKAATSAPGTLTPTQLTDAMLRYGDCLYYNGKYADALAVFRKIKASGGQEGVFATIREADILGRNGSVSEKISILEGLNGAGDAGIWRSTVMSRLAEAYSETGDDKKAAALYAEILDSGGEGAANAQIYYSLAANADNLYKAGDKAAALEAYRRLEKSGSDIFYPAAVTGIMRSSSDNDEIIQYSSKVAALPGISAEDRNEARLLGAIAALGAGGRKKTDAIATLYSLANSTDRVTGAQAAAVLGETLLEDGRTDEAEAVLLALIDNGSDDNYWLARGYITLADVYKAQQKEHLARLYLETLRDNYPGNETDIKKMISSRLNALGK